MRRLLALVIPLVLSGGPALAATPPPSPHHTTHASRVRQPVDKPPVGISFSSVGPGRYLTAASTLRVRGQLANQSELAYQQLSVRLRYSARPLHSRGELDAYADGKGPEPPGLAPLRPQAVTLPTGGRQGFSLSMPVRQMGLPGFGVYPISVEAYSATGTLLGLQRTLVTYYPKHTKVAKTKIAWVWPIIDQPHRADDATFVDDHLERTLSSGRLAALVTAAARTATPLSWLIDPAVVDDAAEMSSQDGYTLKDSTKRTRSTPVATWLSLLHSAIGTADKVVATPYADPDVMALTQRHMTKDVKTATDVAVRKLGAAGPASATTSVAMPPNGLADQATLATLAANGAHTVLLSSAILPDARTQTYTTDPLVTKNVSGHPMKLIAYDDTLRQVLADDTRQPGSTVLAEQRFLAETAMITGETPNDSRTVVVTPPRRWDPDPAFAKAVLSYSAHAPWLSPVTLDAVERLKPVSRVLQPQPGAPGLSRSYLRKVKDLSGRIKRFTSIFRPADSGFVLGVPRIESSAWDGQFRRGTALRQTLDTDLDRTTAKVKVLNDTAVTMVGKSAPIPITVSNGLHQGTVVVRLHVYSQNNTRLQVAAIDRTLTLDPGHKDTITLHMKASANGVGYVNVELLASDGHPFGDTRVLRVRATGYGRTALLITGISLAVLFVGVGIRVVRRRAERVEESVD